MNSTNPNVSGHPIVVYAQPPGNPNVSNMVPIHPPAVPMLNPGACHTVAPMTPVMAPPGLAFPPGLPTVARTPIMMMGPSVPPQPFSHQGFPPQPLPHQLFPTQQQPMILQGSPFRPPNAFVPVPYSHAIPNEPRWMPPTSQQNGPSIQTGSIDSNRSANIISRPPGLEHLSAITEKVHAVEKISKESQTSPIPNFEELVSRNLAKTVPSDSTRTGSSNVDGSSQSSLYVGTSPEPDIFHPDSLMVRYSSKCKLPDNQSIYEFSFSEPSKEASVAIEADLLEPSAEGKAPNFNTHAFVSKESSEDDQLYTDRQTSVQDRSSTRTVSTDIDVSVSSVSLKRKQNLPTTIESTPSVITTVVTSEANTQSRRIQLVETPLASGRCLRPHRPLFQDTPSPDKLSTNRQVSVPDRSSMETGSTDVKDSVISVSLEKEQNLPSTIESTPNVAPTVVTPEANTQPRRLLLIETLSASERCLRPHRPLFRDTPSPEKEDDHVTENNRSSNLPPSQVLNERLNTERLAEKMQDEEKAKQKEAEDAEALRTAYEATSEYLEELRDLERSLLKYVSNQRSIRSDLKQGRRRNCLNVLPWLTVQSILYWKSAYRPRDRRMITTHFLGVRIQFWRSSLIDQPKKSRVGSMYALLMKHQNEIIDEDMFHLKELLANFQLYASELEFRVLDTIFGNSQDDEARLPILATATVHTFPRKLTNYLARNAIVRFSKIQTTFNLNKMENVMKDTHDARLYESYSILTARRYFLFRSSIYLKRERTTENNWFVEFFKSLAEIPSPVLALDAFVLANSQKEPGEDENDFKLRLDRIYCEIV